MIGRQQPSGTRLFLTEVKKSGWEIRPVSGAELHALAAEVMDQPPEVVEWLEKF